MRTHASSCRVIFPGKTELPQGPQKLLMCAQAEAQPEQSGLLSGSRAANTPGPRGAGGRGDYPAQDEEHVHGARKPREEDR